MKRVVITFFLEKAWNKLSDEIVLSFCDEILDNSLSRRPEHTFAKKVFAV